MADFNLEEMSLKELRQWLTVLYGVNDHIGIFHRRREAALIKWVGSTPLAPR